MKGEIWIVKFSKTNGHEQEGTRPVLALADTDSNISVVIPFTSNIQALRFPHTVEIEPSKYNGLSLKSIALVFQVRAIDKKKLKNKVGDLEVSVIKRIDKILKNLLKSSYSARSNECLVKNFNHTRITRLKEFIYRLCP